MTDRATLVLGGGGAAAVAWELGVLAGLAECGFDARTLPVIVGTSAGSVVACRLASGSSLTDLLADARRPPATDPVDVDFRALMNTLADLGADAVSPGDGRRRIGTFALAAATAPAKRRRTEVAALARIDDTSSWPADVALRVTAVDAGSGEFVTFDRDSGVRLLDAVSASCAVPGVWAPVRIGDRYYVDGAVRSPVNASLGSAAPVALILAPLGEPRAITRELRRYAPDALVEVVTADAQAVRAFGPNPLNPAVSAAAAEAGLRQGRGLGDLAGRLRDRLARLGADRVNTG